jgi:hypothetical protein
MWYESMMINETLDSIEDALSNTTIPVKFTICLNSQTYIENPITGIPSEMFSVFMNHPIIKKSTILYKTDDDPFYNIGDWRREVYDNDAKYTVWGESDCLLPNDFFHILSTLSIEEPHILSFSSRKCWDNSWTIVEHEELQKITPVNEGYPDLMKNKAPFRYFDRITQSELNLFNNQFKEIHVNKLPRIKVDGSLLSLSKNLPTPFIPDDMHFVREDTCAANFFEFNKIPQFHVSNRLKGHNYRHEYKRTNTNANRNDVVYLKFQQKSIHSMVDFLKKYEN